MQSVSRGLVPTVLLSLLLGLALAPPSAAQTLTTTFGLGDSCEFKDLQAAVDSLLSRSADERIVKLERGVHQNVAISAETDQLTLLGGFDSCDAPQPRENARSILQGRPDSRVIFHEGSGDLQAGDPPTLRLSQVELAEAGDGGLFIQGPARVFLEDVLILGNSAPAGAGIFVQAFTGLVDLRLDRTSVNGNETTTDFVQANGGGLHCTGSGVLRIGPGSAFIGNKTANEGRGGAISLDGCLLLATGRVNISSNRGHRGGGLALEGEASARFLPDDSGVAEIRFNLAEQRDGLAGRGGGVYLEGGSLLTVEAGRLENNRALPLLGDGGLGGGIFTEGSVATFKGEETVGLNRCDGPCLNLSENEASRGAAGFFLRGSSVKFFQTLVDANVGGSLFELNNGDGAISLGLLVNSIVTRNATPKLFRVENTSSLGLLHVSAGGNLAVETAIEATDLSSLNLRSSVLFEPGAQIANLGDSVDVTAECSLLSDASSFGLHPTVIERDPLFVDAVGGDLHLEATSPAIDLCEELPDLGPDVDGQDRVVDQDVVPDDGTPADAGADEVPFITPIDPFVFADDFESGDFGGWSLVVD